MKITARVINLLKNRDEATFRKFYNEYINLMFYIIYDYISDEDEAKDICQEALLKFLTNLDKIDLKYKDFKPLISKITKNTAIDHIRKKEKENILYNDYLLQNKVENYYRNYDDTLEKYKEILNNDLEYKIILYRFAFDYTLKEIAEEFDIPIITIKRASSSATKKIMQYKKEKDYEKNR